MSDAAVLINSAPHVLSASELASSDDVDSLSDDYLDGLRDELWSLIRHIHDPEHPHSLEELSVVYKSGVTVERNEERKQDAVNVQFTPTVPHCSMATLIGLCIRTKILNTFPLIKFSIHITPGKHQTEQQSKQHSGMIISSDHHIQVAVI
jgi:metal-sulfur cluster biosynthetic enzyme